MRQKLFCCFLVFGGAFFGGCGGDKGSEGGVRGLRDGGSRSSGRDHDERGDFRSEQSRSNERERLRNRDFAIDSTVGKRHTGVGGHVKDYDGPDCGESDECRRICDEITKNRKRCYKAPEELARDMEDGLFTLISISEADAVNFRPALWRGILAIEKKLVMDLVEDHMSAGDLKSFLAWIAINEDIAEILRDEDRSSEIIGTALKELGRLQQGAINKKGTGLNMGLIGREDTFFYLASDEENEAAFDMGYEVLESACPDKNCKMRVLCARERRGRSRSRVFGRNSSAQCRTSSNTRRRRATFRSSACYLQGAPVWSYLYELLEDSEVSDREFKGSPLSIEQCNKHCGNERSETCDTIF